jgi:hypothetical protein
MIYDFDSVQLKDEAKDLYNDLISSVILLKEYNDTIKKKSFSFKSRVKKKNIDRKFAKHFPEVVSHYLYNSILNSIAENESISINTDAENAVLWHLFDKDKDGLKSYSENNVETEKVLNEIKNRYVARRTDSIKKKKIKGQIIYVGRGWVKAGINFKNFNQKNFWYNKERQIIYFHDFDPQILNYDINPWFIPEKKIKGFELIVATGKIKEPLEDSKKVKIRCKEKLRTQAIKAGILKQAKDNASESLKHLFSVLIGEEIKDVIFTRNKYEYIYKEVARDFVISKDEAIILDVLVKQDCRALDTIWYDDFKIQLSNLYVFIEKLKKLKTVSGYFSFNKTTALSAGMFDDSVFSYHEFIIFDSLFSHLNNCKDTLYDFNLKKQLFEFYHTPNPDFNKIYDYLLDDTLNQITYLNIDSTKLFTENRVQYFLSKTIKQKFIRLFLDNLNSRLPSDPCYEDLFWFENTKEFEDAVIKLIRLKINHTDSVSFRDKSKLIIKDKYFFEILTGSIPKLVNDSLIKVDTNERAIFSP